ncbi:MAG: hypothetical protein EXS37_14335 [Opitutus sp.]|nr:hypothetical protein [Opitutus sp.]
MKSPCYRRGIPVNLKTVVASDEFGNISEGSVGEFAKFLPGVSVNRLAADVISFTLRGPPTKYTVVPTDGNGLASVNSSNLGRQFETEQLSINNVARFEISLSPTPDSHADAMGGSINLVSKSAFERAQPFGSLTRQWIPDGLAVSAGYTRPTDNRPYLARYAAVDGPKDTTRTSVGATLDFKLSPDDVFTLRSQYTYYDASFFNQNLNFDVGTGVTAWGPTFTQGGPGIGIVSFNPNQQGRKTGGTFAPSLAYRHNGRTWKFEANAAYAHASNQYINQQKGFFETNSIRLTGVTVRFEEIAPEGRPRFVVTTPACAPVDIHRLGNYWINTVANRQRHSWDDVLSGNAHARRDFDFKIPLALKTGIDVRRTTRDIQHLSNGTGTFIGRDGIANFADDSAGDIVDEVFSQRVPGFEFFGLPRLQWPSNYKLHALHAAHPEYFRWDDAGEHRNIVNNSIEITETITAAYLRADVWLFNNRLWLIGGVRFENSHDDGFGPLVDNDALYQQDAGGPVLRDGAGRPILVTTVPLAQAKLTHRYRGIHATKDYQDFYPSLNGVLNLTEKLVMRAAYGRTLGRPDYGNIVPGVTVPDPASTSTTITIKNTALKPWTADSYDLALEYYFQTTGVASVGVF